MRKAAFSALKPGSFAGDAVYDLVGKVQAAMGRPLKSFTHGAALSAAADDGGVYVSPAGVGPEGLCAFVNPASSGAAGARMLQHVRAETTLNANGAARTVLRDATSGATIGYALGAPTAADADASTPLLSDATLLLIDEPSVLFVPAGERPPPAVARPTAPAIRRLVEREP